MTATEQQPTDTAEPLTHPATHRVVCVEGVRPDGTPFATITVTE
jgi:hypothetical protein